MILPLDVLICLPCVLVCEFVFGCSDLFDLCVCYVFAYVCLF